MMSKKCLRNLVKWYLPKSQQMSLEIRMERTFDQLMEFFDDEGINIEPYLELWGGII